MQNTFDSLTVPFMLRSDWLLGNLSYTSGIFEADFDDGAGWQSLTTDQVVTVTYATDSLKRIGLRFIDGADTLEAQSILYVSDPSSVLGNKLSMAGYSEERDGTIEDVNGCIISYWKGNTCGREVSKPLIIVKGFDPQNQYDHSRMFKLISNPDLILPSGKTLNESVYEEGYDIFYVDVTESTASLRYVNGEVVKNAIKKINELKRENGSNEKSIVFGASAGGVLSKIALRQMELAGEDHETEILITFDSPLQGANIPLGFQLLLNSLGDFKLFGAIPLKDISHFKELKNGINTLNSDAARELLYYHGSYYDGCATCPASQFSVSHDQFYTWFEGLGDLIIPQISLSNGAQNGNGQLFSPGEELAHDVTGLHGILGELFDWLTGLGKVRIEYRIHALPDGGVGKIYFNKFTHRKRIGRFHVTLSSSIKDVSISGAKPWDSAPGGIRPFNKIKEGEEDRRFKFDYKYHCFIPTISSLDLDVTDPYFNANDNQAVTNSGATSLNNYVGSIVNTPNRLNEGPNINQEHIYFDKRNATFLQSYLTKLRMKLPLSGRTYNFGFSEDKSQTALVRRTLNVIGADVTVSGDEQIWINRKDRLAYTDNSLNPMNDSPKLFKVYVQPNNCDNAPVTVDVKSGGKIVIGDKSVGNQGQLHVMPTSTVNVLEGGEVLLEKDYHNTLVLQGGTDDDGNPENATLNIEAGGIVKAQWGSRILVNENGVLHVKSGGTLRIQHYSSLEIREGGKLIIDPGANIELWDGSDPDGSAKIHTQYQGELVINGDFNFSGNGYFEFDKAHILTLNATFKLKGKGKGFRFAKLNANCHMRITEFGLKWEEGKVEYEPSAKILLLDNTFGHFRRIDFPGAENATAVEAVEAYFAYFAFCDFMDWTSAATIKANAIRGGSYQFSQSLYLEINNCNFSDCRLGVDADNLDKLNIRRSTFGNAPNGKAVKANNIRNGYFLETTVEGYSLKAVELIDVENMVVKKSYLANNGIAIHLSERIDGIGCNLDLICSTLETNQVGILMEKMSLRGALTMRYSALICNEIGVFGTDVELNVHGGRNYFRLCDEPITEEGPENTVILTGQSLYGHKLFDLCFTSNLPTHIPASYNMWQTNYDDQPVPGIPQDYMYTIREGNDCEVLDFSFSYIVDGRPLMQPAPCPTIHPHAPVEPEVVTDEDIINEILCSVLKNNQQFPIYSNFIEAETVFAEETSEEASARPSSQAMHYQLASIPNIHFTNLSTYCQSIIKIARARIAYDPNDPNNTGGGDEEGGNEGGYNQGKVKFGSNGFPVSTIEGYPNPTDGEFTIPLEEGQYHFRLFDIFGKKVLSGDYNSTIRLDMTSYEKGMYLIHIENTDTGEMKSGKVIVQ